MMIFSRILFLFFYGLMTTPSYAQNNAFGEEDLDAIENDLPLDSDFSNDNFAEDDFNIDADFQPINNGTELDSQLSGNEQDFIEEPSNPLVNQALGDNEIEGADPDEDIFANDGNGQEFLNQNGNLTQSNVASFESEDIFANDSQVNLVGQQEFLEGEAPPIEGTVLEEIREPNLFAGAPPVPGTMRILAENEAPEEYRVVPGDTLFDICDQLIDEPSYWPKLWSFNTFIKNPHFIYPGMILRFYPGGDETPPFLQIVTEDDLVPVDKGPLDGLEAENLDGLIARFEGPSSIDVIGPEEVGDFPEIDEAFINVGSFFAPQEYNVIIPAFISPAKLNSLGEVVSGSGGSILLDTDEDLVVRTNQGQLTPGGSYSVVRFTSDVDHPETGNSIGFRYEFVAHIKVLSPISDGKHVSAEVFMNRIGVEPGDLIVEFKSVKRSVPMFAKANQLSGHYVVGFDIPKMAMGGKGSFVFLASTAASGALPIGQTVEIFQDYGKHSGAIDASSLPSYRVKVAEAHVIDQSGQASLAYITKDKLEVRLGDDTGMVSSQ